MDEYKISKYTWETLTTQLQRTGQSGTAYAIYKKDYPFPNKSITLWKEVARGFRTEKQAQKHLEKIIKKS